MKRLALLLSSLTFLSCAGTQANIVQPDVDLIQVVGPADQNYPSGAMEVQFALRVRNNSSEPITLRQVQVMPVGEGGPYRVVAGTYHFNVPIPPNASVDHPFWARAVGSGDPHALDANAPVNVRAVAQFQSPAGRFQKILMRTFGQHGRGIGNDE